METVNEHSSLLVPGRRRSSTTTTRRTSVTAHDVLIKNESYDDNDDRMHGLSSAIITSTHVLLQPNFSALDDDEEENDDDDAEAATTTAGPASTPSPRRFRRPLQVRRKSSIVLSSRGTIASPGGQRIFQSGGRRKSVRVVQGMINAVSTSSILNLVVASAGTSCRCCVLSYSCILITVDRIEHHIFFIHAYLPPFPLIFVCTFGTLHFAFLIPLW